jgi:hypothetical protein
MLAMTNEGLGSRTHLSYIWQYNLSIVSIVELMAIDNSRNENRWMRILLCSVDVTAAHCILRNFPKEHPSGTTRKEPLSESPERDS